MKRVVIPIVVFALVIVITMGFFYMPRNIRFGKDALNLCILYQESKAIIDSKGKYHPSIKSKRYIFLSENKSTEKVLRNMKVYPSIKGIFKRFLNSDSFGKWIVQICIVSDDVNKRIDVNEKIEYMTNSIISSKYVDCLLIFSNGYVEYNHDDITEYGSLGINKEEKAEELWRTLEEAMKKDGVKVRYD